MERNKRTVIFINGLDAPKRGDSRSAHRSIFGVRDPQMVNNAKKNERCLYLIARRDQWNKPDRRGSRPFNCKICEIDKGYAEIHGCKEERKQGARQFGPHSLTRCPNYYLKKPDTFRDEVIQVFQDYRSGVLTDWPDAYSGALTAGVRIVDRELNACESELMRERANEQKANASRGR